MSASEVIAQMAASAVSRGLRNNPRIGLEYLAEIFCAMDAEGQAMFFDCVASMAAQWPEKGTGQWLAMRQHMTGPAKDLLVEMKG